MRTLWSVLEPCGLQGEPATVLRGKKVAVDVGAWVVEARTSAAAHLSHIDIRWSNILT